MKILALTIFFFIPVVQGMTCTEALEQLGLTASVRGTLEIPAEHQKRVDALKKRRNAKEVRFIEEGGEAIILRVSDADGVDRILRGRTDDYSDNFDIDSFKLLATLPQGGEHFRTPQNVKSHPGKWIEYADVRGRELAEVLHKLRKSHPLITRQLANLYNKRVTSLRAELSKRGWVVESKWEKQYGHKILHIYAAPTKEDLEKRTDLLSTDLRNVILDPDSREMTLIDLG